MPKRIQMTRNKPWRKDNPDAVIVSSCKNNKWGNPYKVGKYGDAQQCVDAYVYGVGNAEGVIPYDDLHELRGKDLACWCPLDQPCHADVLLKLANK